MVMTKTALKDWMPVKNTRSPAQGFPPCLASTRHGYLSLISAGIDHDPSTVFPMHRTLSLLFELGLVFSFLPILLLLRHAKCKVCQ